jgi:hypothetical protein
MNRDVGQEFLLNYLSFLLEKYRSLLEDPFRQKKESIISLDPFSISSAAKLSMSFRLRVIGGKMEEGIPLEFLPFLFRNIYFRWRSSFSI